MRYFTKGLCVLGFGLLGWQGQARAQAPNPQVDVSMHSTHKYFYDQGYPMERIWERKEHDCPAEPPKAYLRLFESVYKSSQSHLEALIKGNVSLSVQKLMPMPQEILDGIRNQSPLERDVIVRCIAGYSHPLSMYEASNLDYFTMVVEHYRFLRQIEDISYSKGGRRFDFRLIRSTKDLEEVMKAPTQLGGVLALEGLRAFTESIYLKDNMRDSEEAKALLLKNARRLKGSLPLVENTEEFIDAPFMFVQLAHLFPTGVVGTINRSRMLSQRLFGSIVGDKIGITDLGMDLVRVLLDARDGRRILVDVSGMTAAARKDYYRYLNDHLYTYPEDTIPVVASSTSISGLSWDDPSYKYRYTETDAKQLLLHTEEVLAEQDLAIILRTKGLIGLSLDLTHHLEGTKVAEIQGNMFPNSIDYREFVVKLLVANMCRAVEVTGDPEMWDRFSIASNFDFNSPFPPYSSAQDLPTLREDLLRFFKAPKNIYGMYSVDDIEAFMYDLSPEEIVDKVMGQNAYNFIYRHFQKMEVQKPAQTTVTKD